MNTLSSKSKSLKMLQLSLELVLMKLLIHLRILMNSKFQPSLIKTGDSSSEEEVEDAAEDLEEEELGNIWLISSSTWLNNSLKDTRVEKTMKKRRKKAAREDVETKSGLRRELSLQSYQKTTLLKEILVKL